MFSSISRTIVDKYNIKVNLRTKDLNPRALTNPAKVFFDIAYRLGLCPFKLKINGISCTATTWIPQQVIMEILKSIKTLKSASFFADSFHHFVSNECALLHRASSATI